MPVRQAGAERELTPEEAMRFLQEPQEPLGDEQELTPEQAMAFLQRATEPSAGVQEPPIPRGVIQEVPYPHEDTGEAPSPFAAFGGTLLEKGADIAQFAQMFGRQHEQGLREAGAPDWMGQPFVPPDAEPPLDPERLRGLAQDVYPNVQRGRGGFWGETVPGGVAATLPTVAAGLIGGPGAATLTSGAQRGSQAYNEAKAEGATEGKAKAAMGASMALAIPEALMGAGGALTKLKAAKPGLIEVGKTILKTIGEEVPQEMVDQILSDGILEVTTGKDREILKNAIETLGPSAVIAFLFGSARGLAQASKGRGQAGEAQAPGQPLATHPESPPAKASSAAEPAPGAEATIPPAGPAAGEPAGLEPGGEELRAKPSAPLLQPEDLSEEQMAPDVAPTQPPQRGHIAATGTEPSQATGISNAAVQKELDEMGVEPPTKGQARPFVQIHAEAKAKLQAEPEAGQDLVTRLEAEPRAPSDTEDALLTFEARRLVNKRAKAQEAYNADPTPANEAAVNEAQAAYERAANVFDRVGTESGRSLNARKLMLKEDFSLANMQREIRAAKGGKDLTREEKQKVAKLHAELEAATKAHEEYVKAADLKIAALEAERDLAALKKEVARGDRRAKRTKDIEKTKKEIKDLWDELGRVTTGKMHAGGTDTETLIVLGKLAGKVVKLGAQTFEQWSSAVVARLGEDVRPHLKGIWDQAERDAAEGIPAKQQARRTRLSNEIKELERRIAEKDFAKKERKPVPPDDEATRLLTERESVKRRFAAEKERHRRATRTKTQKALDVAKEIIDAPREILSAYDFSAPFRQGLIFTVAHPFQSTAHAYRMFRAWGSTRKALEMDVKLRNHPLYALAQQAGLHLSDLDAIGPTEEHIRSTLAKKLPGVKASNRAFVTYLNQQRMARFVDMMGAAPTAKPTMQQAKAVAQFINIATGRGDPGKFAGATDLLSKVFWSPRLQLSRVQALAGYGLWRPKAKGMRMQIAKEYARFIVGASALLALGTMAADAYGEDEVEVGRDWRSSDFGKIKIGDVRIDVLGGFGQYATQVGRWWTGEKVSAEGKVEDFQGRDLWQFLANKFAPIPSGIHDLRFGRPGEEVTLEGELLDLAIPISFRDVKENLEERGVSETAALTLLSMFGVGVQAYGDKK